MLAWSPIGLYFKKLATIFNIMFQCSTVKKTIVGALKHGQVIKKFRMLNLVYFEMIENGDKAS